MPKHCVKSVQIGSFFWSVFSRIWIEYEKYGPEKTPYLDIFHEVKGMEEEELVTAQPNFSFFHIS